MTAVRTAFALACCLAMLGCTNQPHGYYQRKLAVAQTYQGSGPIRVVCTTGMVADLVRNVGGKHVAVEPLFSPDVDPHQYKATPEDVRKLNRAEAIFYNGLHLEGKMTELLDRLARTIPAFPVGEYLDESRILRDDGGNPDPHIWFDVALWSDAGGAVRDALCLFDPAHASDYRANAERYQ